MSYTADMVSIILLGPDAGRHAGKFAWDVSFPDPHSGLDQDGYSDTLDHALMCVSCALENARDTQRLCIAEEKARARILDDAHKLGRAGFGLPARELP